MKKKILYFIFGLFMVIGTFFLYNYSINDYKNVRVGISNTSHEEFVYLEIYWDNVQIGAEKVVEVYPLKDFRFNANWGRHSLLVKGADFEKEFAFWVLPFLHIHVEYCGRNEYEAQENQSLLLVWHSMSPLMFD